MILGIETSCDETAAAVVSDGGTVLASIVSSQAELHARFGGVVPEVASRRHLELVTPVVRAALEAAEVSLDEIDRVAVTQGPGLVGALLVGISTAKAIAWGRGLPLAPVDHLEGHVASLYLEPDPVEPPFTCLFASGGHTLLLAVRERGSLGAAGDDARRRCGRGVRQGSSPARARVSGRRGDRPARAGGGCRGVRLPGRPRSRARLLLLWAQDGAPVCGARTRCGRGGAAQGRPRSVVPACDRPSAGAAPARRPRGVRLRPVAVVGGVAANSELRAALPDAAFAPLALCTDNAAMIASCARFVEAVPYPRYLALDAYASLA